MQGPLRFLASGRNGLWAALALLAVLVACFWVGFIASDDTTYAVGAYGWIDAFPYVGGHGTIRYPITIPMALSFLTFGNNEFAFVLPSLLALVAFLFVVWNAVRNRAGEIPAFAALIAVVTCPLIAIQASIASVDIIEMALLFGAFVLTLQCTENGPSRGKLLLAGALCGLAFLTRETAVFVAVFYALLFLTGYGFVRWHYLWVAAGFLAVWGLEILYLTVMTGDPLYRFNIAMNHDSTIDRTVDLAGNVIVHPVIDPLLVLFANQEFMLLMFVAVPAALWLCFGKGIAAPVKRMARLMSLFGIVWFVCVGAAQSLLPLNPRYFMITSTMAAILAGMAIGMLMCSNRIKVRWAALLVLLALVGTNFIAIYVENKQPAFGEEALIAVLEAQSEPVVTDPMTRFRSRIPLRWVDGESRVSEDAPQPGDLYFYNPVRSEAPNAFMTAEQLPAYQPAQSWDVVATYAPEPSYLALGLEMTGISTRIPQGLWQKLRYRHPPATLYRVK